MDPAHRRGHRTAPQHPFEQLVAHITRTHPIPVRHQRLSAAYQQLHWPILQLHADLLPQERTAPRIVIAADVDEPHTRLPQVGQGSKRVEIRAGHRRAQLAPEIEQVTVDHQKLRSPLPVPQEADERTLDRVGDGAQVQIGYDESGLHHALAPL